MSLSQEQAAKRFKECEIILVGEFQGFDNYSKCLCPICGQLKLICLRSALKTKKCKDCSKKNNPKKDKFSETYIKEKLYSLGIILIDYTDTSKHMNVICECGKPWRALWANILRGTRCGCKKRYNKDHHMWKLDRTQLMEDRKFKKACYTMVTRCMNRKTNKNHTEELLGYTSEQLQHHIKNHPDYLKSIKSNKRLSIDHIIPLQAFKDHDMLNENYIWLINHLDNLRPTNISWNSKKSSKYNIEDFNDYLSTHGVIISKHQI